MRDRVHRRRVVADHPADHVDVVNSAVVKYATCNPQSVIDVTANYSLDSYVLFIVFVNDISDLFSGDTCVKLFADDVKLYCKVCINPHLLQEDLNRIVEWSHTWQLPISYSKCCIFDLYHPHDDTYSIGNCVLPTVQEIVDLGVTMNNSLKFSKHIAKVTVKGHRMANLILKCFLSRDINSLTETFHLLTFHGLTIYEI